MIRIYILTLISLSVFSFGFIDRNIPVDDNHLLIFLRQVLGILVYEKRLWSTLIYLVIVSLLFIFYLLCLSQSRIYYVISRYPRKFLILVSLILFISFPALSYDIFNYMTTAKVAFFHKENPYLVMPIEISNEPWLAFTRAANKVALYGPTWIAITWFPFQLGKGNLLATIYAFKFVMLINYFIMLILIYRLTNNFKNVIFFGLNPLVLIEVLVSAHNDIVMMVLAVTYLILIGYKNFKSKLIGLFFFISSVFVKGATIVLFPFLFMGRNLKLPVFQISYWLMFAIFLLTPVREELYPWYAVWFITFAALTTIKKDSMLHAFTIAMTIGLSLRHVPYLYTREYGGYGPVLRTMFTLAPPLFFGLYMQARSWLIKSTSNG